MFKVLNELEVKNKIETYEFYNYYKKYLDDMEEKSCYIPINYIFNEVHLGLLCTEKILDETTSLYKEKIINNMLYKKEIILNYLKKNTFDFSKIFNYREHQTLTIFHEFSQMKLIPDKYINDDYFSSEFRKLIINNDSFGIETNEISEDIIKFLFMPFVYGYRNINLFFKESTIFYSINHHTDLFRIDYKKIT